VTPKTLAKKTLQKAPPKGISAEAWTEALLWASTHVGPTGHAALAGKLASAAGPHQATRLYDRARKRCGDSSDSSCSQMQRAFLLCGRRTAHRQHLEAIAESMPENGYRFALVYREHGTPRGLIRFGEELRRWYWKQHQLRGPKEKGPKQAATKAWKDLGHARRGTRLAGRGEQVAQLLIPKARLERKGTYLTLKRESRRPSSREPNQPQETQYQETEPRAQSPE